MMRQMDEMHRQQAMQQQQPQAQAGAPEPKTNPLPMNDAGFHKFKEEQPCPARDETLALNGLLQNMRSFVKSGEIAADLAIIAQQSALAEDVCFENKKERQVADFTKDDILMGLHKKTLDIQTSIKTLHTELVEKSHELESLIQERWERTVKSYGLNPEKYHYFIDDERNIVFQAELDCDSCTCNQKLSAIREAFEAKLNGAAND